MTPRPTERQLLAWWAEQERTGPKTRTCRDCGKTGPSAYVQPQHPYYADGAEGIARCGECIDRGNREARSKRKAELAARPPDCQRCGRRPHTWKVAGFRLCGPCKAVVLAEHARNVMQAGALAVFAEGALVDTRGWASRQGAGLDSRRSEAMEGNREGHANG